MAIGGAMKDVARPLWAVFLVDMRGFRALPVGMSQQSAPGPESHGCAASCALIAGKVVSALPHR
jgi:hypothetical protein